MPMSLNERVRMESIVEFVLPVNQDEFNEWIENYLPEEGRLIIYFPDDGQPEILDVNEEGYSAQAHVSKIDRSPQMKRIVNENYQYYLPVRIGDLAKINKGLGFFREIFIFSTKEVDTYKSLIKIDWSKEEVRPFFIDLFGKMMLEWPETKRELLKHLPSPYESKKDNILYEFFIDADPEKLLNIISELISENPFRFMLETRKDKEYETSIHSSEIFPPDDNNAKWEFLLLASTKINVRDTSSQNVINIKRLDNWNIGRIELIKQSEKRLHLICYAQYENPEVDGLLYDIARKLRMVYPIYDKETDGKTFRQRDQNLRTQLRAEVFKKLKDENPGWTQEKVAEMSRDILKEEVTANTVRNTYRLMDWKWKRGDRTR